MFGSEVQAVPLDFRDPRTFEAAVVGCSELFLLRPPAISNTAQTLNPFIDVARARGVGHVVFLSVAGAGQNKIVPHHAVEVHLALRGADWTVLRPGFFAQNLEAAYLQDIREDDRLYVPAGRARVAFVDVRDVAEVAASALLEPSVHVGRAYTLTGAEALTFEAVAELLSNAIGRSIRYVPATALGYLWHLHRRGLPVAQALVQTLLHVGLRFGQAEDIDPTLESLLDRTPRTMRDYLYDLRATWVH